MRFFFYAGLICLAVFEVLNVYFIMPMPGSQQMNSVDVAYFLYSYRWIFRGIFGVMIIVGSPSAFQTKRMWIPLLAILPVAFIVYTFNFRMTADHMFLQPEKLVFHGRSMTSLIDSTLVIAVEHNSEAKAYPVRYILYHHQVRDTVGGLPVMVTYCNVCRTGRVFEPNVNGRNENFRLVGMDHFNAMFEDKETKSWWRQATGEAVTGPLKGQRLPEILCHQYTLGKFFSLHPFGKVMEAEPQSMDFYDTLGRFEKGLNRGRLTRSDSLSWKEKSWVIGIEIDGASRAFDWNVLKEERVVNSDVAGTPIAVAIASDNNSFIAIRRENDEQFTVRNDSLVSSFRSFDFAGRSSTGTQAHVLKSYQEFWHSWKEFHPNTSTYPDI